MARRPSYTDLAAAHEQTKEALGLAELAVHLLWTAECDASERFTEGDDTYLVKTYGCTRGDGGVVFVIFKHPGQTDSVRFYYTEKWIASTRSERVQLAWVLAAERIQKKVRAIQEAKDNDNPTGDMLYRVEVNEENKLETVSRKVAVDKAVAASRGTNSVRIFQWRNGTSDEEIIYQWGS